MLTRKYYRMIARIIQIHSDSTNDNIDKNQFVNDLCDEFHNDNSYFDKDKFVEACK